MPNTLSLSDEQKDISISGLTEMMQKMITANTTVWEALEVMHAALVQDAISVGRAAEGLRLCCNVFAEAERDVEEIAVVLASFVETTTTTEAAE